MQHPFMDKNSIPKWLDVNNAAHMEWVHYFADPASKFGVVPTKQYWEFLTKTKTSPRRIDKNNNNAGTHK